MGTVKTNTSIRTTAKETKIHNHPVSYFFKFETVGRTQPFYANQINPIVFDKAKNGKSLLIQWILSYGKRMDM